MQRLIDRHLPGDYHDSVSSRISPTRPLTKEMIFERMFLSLPRPAALMMRVRNAIVRPFGLQPGGSFRDLVTEKSEEEIVISKNDRHLSFWVGIFCSKMEDGWQDASITTVVRYNNLFGRLYFAIIWVFHKVLARSLFKKATGQDPSL